MNHFDASRPDTPFVRCAVCEKAIMSGKWFARIRHESWMVTLCCPLCTEVFEAKPAAYVRRIQTLQNQPQP